MIKILFFIPTLGHGGAERVLVNLVNHMDQNKYSITVQTMFDVGIYREQLCSSIRYIRGFKWYFRGNTIAYKLLSPQWLYKLYIREHYDIIVSYLEGPSARVVSGCDDTITKLITWIHTEHKSVAYATSVFRNKAEADNCYNRFNRIICVSDSVRQDFIKLFSVSASVNVLYNTVEADVIRQKKDEFIEEISFSPDEINICSVAKLIKTKGFDRLIRIQRRLRDDGLPVHIYIVGAGEEKKTLEKLIEENRLQKYWTFLGFKENPYKYVARANLYVCSSWREGFSTAVTEALIVGMPVVSTDCSGAKELLGYNNEYGIVTENDEEALYQGIKRMLTEDGLLPYYKQKATERGCFFNTEEAVMRAERMFEEATES